MLLFYGNKISRPKLLVLPITNIPYYSYDVSAPLK
jgi:hypothetical protein